MVTNLMDYSPVSTNVSYSPHSQLPAPIPKETSYLTRHFYEHTSKHLIKDTVKIMMNGVHIDLDEVKKLEDVVTGQLQSVADELSKNPLIKQYLILNNKNQIEAYKEERATKLRSPDYYSKPFNYKDMLHRSYFMHLYATEQGINLPTDEVLPGVSKWTASLVKKLNRPILIKLLSGSLSLSHHLIINTQQELAKLKASIYNKSFLSQIDNPKIDYPVFNPASTKQKTELFEMLGIKSESVTKKGNPQWDRDQVVIVNKTSKDDNVVHLTSQIISYSFAGIIRSNFIKAFYNYTIESRLYGTYKLISAKTARYTSSNPNMLNFPSTGSIFSKPVKKCFTAPKGFLVASIDYSGLEDRVTANITGDPVKSAIFTEGLDGHSVAATYYFRDAVVKLVPPFGDSLDDHKRDAKDFKKLVDFGNEEAKAIRQAAKAPNFKLAYGGYPDYHKGGVVTQELFDLYHYRLYPKVSSFREDYVVPTAMVYGECHLGLGFSIKTDNPDRDQRTLLNGHSQFWSILSLLTINKLHQLIDEKGYQDDIIVTSTIYDSIYFEIRNDPTVISWLNDAIVPVMETDFMCNQSIPNEANLEIGLSWADLVDLPHYCGIAHVKAIIKKLK